MKEPLKITTSTASHFINALHTQFHNEMYGILMSNISLEQINITAQDMKEYKTLIDIEIDINKETTASDETKRLAVVDNLRDDILSYIFGVIRAARKSPVEDQRAAAERLNISILKTYNGLQQEGLDEETIHIIGLITDLRKDTIFADMQKLGLNTMIDKLEQANEEFRRIRAERSMAQIVRKLPTAKEIRPQTDNIYEKICSYIIASHLLSTDNDVCESIENLVVRMNKFISEIKTVSKQTGKKKQ